MSEVFDARRFNAGEIGTALAVPFGPSDSPRSVGPFAVIAHALPFETPPGALPQDFDVRPHLPGDTESFTPAPADDGRPLLRLNQP